MTKDLVYCHNCIYDLESKYAGNPNYRSNTKVCAHTGYMYNYYTSGCSKFRPNIEHLNEMKAQYQKIIRDIETLIEEYQHEN